ncbi:MAG: transglycosylase [Desulfobulbaceae bacterium]|nr:transglycosylase [Desulfobulbaceae bacterium]
MESFQQICHGGYGACGSFSKNRRRKAEDGKLIITRGRKCWCILAAFCFIYLLPSGCARKPLLSISAGNHPAFSDDLQYHDLRQAIKKSLSYLRGKPQDAQLTLADRSSSISQLVHSLQFFQNLLTSNPTETELARNIDTYFDVFQASGTGGFNPNREMLVTGYYQPLLEGSLKRQPPYLYPLYSVPDDLVVKLGLTPKERTIGRLDGGTFYPYWTRHEIETLNKAEDHELVWLKSPVDAFILHVQGSGLIRLPDGSIRGVHYAIKNGHRYRSIGKYMVDTGKIKLEQAGLDTIRAYIAAHPEERDEILHHNDSFIFFHWTETHGAIGSLGQELTPGRSIAVDQNCFPAGALAFLITKKPVLKDGRVINWTSLKRFVLVQDKGSAIRGPGRVDLFWGAGDHAGTAAGRMKEAGQLYFLLLKKKYAHNAYPAQAAEQ